ncbi:hypothetical protein FB384_000434 [Prauserella sediminis]|uniref:Uncharacterized protein n=2 Tax=Prauserella TaxID=142577 RepID=A0A839S347_9PSEU|nr:hypothetical protein [Prauserella isguenensis]MBB3661530.1 hypothetical protein [Prauserella sediminis]
MADNRGVYEAAAMSPDRAWVSHKTQEAAHG